MNKKYTLDAYEQDLEDNLEKCFPIKHEEELKKMLVTVARRHLRAKKPITIRISTYDIEGVKIKASKMGIPYQTYINMLIHKDVQRL